MLCLRSLSFRSQNIGDSMTTRLFHVHCIKIIAIPSAACVPEQHLPFNDLIDVLGQQFESAKYVTKRYDSKICSTQIMSPNPIIKFDMFFSHGTSLNLYVLPPPSRQCSEASWALMPTFWKPIFVYYILYIILCMSMSMLYSKY